MLLRLLRENEISSELDMAIRRNLILLFPHNKSLFSAGRNWRGNTPLYTVIIEQNDVCAHLAITDRTIMVGNEQVHVAGVANTFVMPEYRGKGYVGKMLELAMSQARKLGLDFGMLFAVEAIKKVYSRYGWIEIIDQK